MRQPATGEIVAMTSQCAGICFSASAAIIRAEVTLVSANKPAAASESQLAELAARTAGTAPASSASVTQICRIEAPPQRVCRPSCFHCRGFGRPSILGPIFPRRRRRSDRNFWKNTSDDRVTIASRAGSGRSWASEDTYRLIGRSPMARRPLALHTLVVSTLI